MPDPRFHEEQGLRHWWLWLLVGAIAVAAWWSFVHQIVLGRPFGTNPGPDWVVWLVTGVCGVVVPVTLLAARLVVDVSPDGVRLHYRPFRNRWIEARSVVGFEVVTYRPIRQWGGWGIRYAFGRGWAYTAYGTQGVRLELEDGRSLLVGSQRPEALAAALEGMRAAV